MSVNFAVDVRMKNNRHVKTIGMVVLLASVVLLTACSSSENKPSQTSSAPPQNSSAPTITQFYASKPTLPKGETSLLCYGVEGAATVAIDPPIEQLTPSLSRCLNVSPKATTKYTLTAKSTSGAKATRDVTITVGGGPVKLVDFSVNALTLKRGQQASVCFKAQNAVSVTGGPGHFFMKANPAKDCLMDTPAKTTTYRITVHGSSGDEDSQSVTVKVQ